MWPGWCPAVSCRLKKRRLETTNLAMKWLTPVGSTAGWTAATRQRTPVPASCTWFTATASHLRIMDLYPQATHAADGKREDRGVTILVAVRPRRDPLPGTGAARPPSLGVPLAQ